MPRTTKTAASRIGASAALAAIALIATATAANAATLNDAGSGFVGKGEVQSAFGLNNQKMQQLVEGDTIRFSTTQAASQTLSQVATQSVKETGSQVVVRTLSCTVEDKKKTFTAYGTRDGERTGTRTGTRTGSLSGSLTGNLVSNIAYDNKKTGQYTGFYLKGFAEGSPVFNPTGTPVWDAEASYPDPAEFTSPLVLDKTRWGGWESEPGENPADCDRTDTVNGVPVVSDRSDTLDETALVETTLKYGDESVGGDIKYGDPTGNGPASLFVTSVLGGPKPLTITAPVV